MTEDASSVGRRGELHRSGRGVEPLLFRSLKRPIAGAAHDRLPVHAVQELFDFGGGHARRVAAADQRAHAGAGNAIDRYAHLLQDLEHPNVCSAPGPPTCQHQADPRPLDGLAG